MPDPRQAGERIAALLEEIRSISDARVRARAEELVRLLMELYGAGLERLLRVDRETRQAAAPRLRWRPHRRRRAGVESAGAPRPPPGAVEDRVARHREGPALSRLARRRHRAGRASRTAKPCCGSREAATAVRRRRSPCVTRSRARSRKRRRRSSGSGVEQPAAAERSERRRRSSTPVPARRRSRRQRRRLAGDDAPRGRSQWVALDDRARARARRDRGVRGLDAPILLCRLDEGLYAYRDRCPACDSPFAGGRLERHPARLPDLRPRLRRPPRRAVAAGRQRPPSRAAAAARGPRHRPHRRSSTLDVAPSMRAAGGD